MKTKSKRKIKVKTNNKSNNLKKKFNKQKMNYRNKNIKYCVKVRLLYSKMSQTNGTLK